MVLLPILLAFLGAVAWFGIVRARRGVEEWAHRNGFELTTLGYAGSFTAPSLVEARALFVFRAGVLTKDARARWGLLYVYGALFSPIEVRPAWSDGTGPPSARESRGAV